MKFKILTLFTLFLMIIKTIACTTFIIEDSENLVFGRNLDWVSDEGLVVVNKKGVKKTAFVPLSPKPATWVSVYGSISFNQFGKELPFGGMNEEGLVVEIMVSKAEYPEKDDRFEINESQWIQYQLDNCKTVEEVLATNKNIRIKALREDLHYLICDKQGNKAVIEFCNGEMVVVKNEELSIPVLENKAYETSLNLYKQNKLSRFTTVANSLKDYKKTRPNPINYSFEILDEVALDGSWSIVYDIKNSQVYFKSSSQKKIKRFNVKAFNFDCSQPSLILDINTTESGEVTKCFKEYSEEANTEIVKKAIVSNGLSWPISIEKKLLNYANTCFCVWR